ncbi:MFS transporter [Kitasatospora sp. NPDC004615]|uniref:MFS transporter n=1 Tax=Kitasatospora sp. NPDC004615 TaxID=3364017 RepID=UPI0036BC83E5
MKSYLSVLRLRDYRLLWSASVLNLLGDGATWTALSWLAISKAGAGALGVLAICYTMPVIVGGAFVGPLLDRFSRKFVLIGDSVLRGVIVAGVPLIALFGDVPLWQLYAVAGTYGLLKIVPLGAVPTIVPELVPKEQLQPAAALETIAYGAAGFAGPALGGVLIPVIGGEAVLALDAASYLLFALAIWAIRAPLSRPEPAAPAAPTATGKKPKSGNWGWGPVFALLKQDKVLLSITVGFALFNCAMGMLRVTNPWLAHNALPGGAETLGLLLAAANGAGLIGSLIAGALKPSDKQMGRIGLLQIFAGASLGLLLILNLPVILIGLVLSDLLSAPMTVSSQVVRMVRIPAEVRGRTMTFMRTLMNSTSPAGAALAAALLAGNIYRPTVVIMTLVAAVPGLFMWLAYRKTSFSEELGLNKSEEPAAEPAPAPAR